MKSTPRLLKSLIAVAVSLIFAASFMPKALATDPSVVDTTHNPNLYAALHAAGLDPTNSNSIRQSEMEALNGTLNLDSSHGISNLTSIEGLEYCIHVSEINLSGNTNLSSIEPLESVELDDLTALDLSHTKVTLPADLQMPNLASLDLSYNSVIDNDGIAGIDTGNVPRLTTVYMEHCSNLGSIFNLRNVQQIEYLYLDYSNIASLPTSLAGMTGLTYLGLNGVPNLNTPDNLAAIASVPNLARLEICHTNIPSVSFLSGKTSLQALLWNNMTVDINLSTVSGLTNLTSLDISNDSGVNGNISALSSLTGINALGIGYCEVADLTSIHNMPLTWLNIYGDYITDLTPISGKAITILSAGMNYLDLTSGSPDRTILDDFGIVDSTWLSANEQYKFTISYDCHGKGTPSKTAEGSSLYYGQSVTLPIVSGISSGYTFAGWDIDGDYSPDPAPDGSALVTSPIPAPTDALTYTGIFDSPDAISSNPLTPVIGNKILYDKLMALYPGQVGQDHVNFITQGELENLTGAMNLASSSLTSVEGLEYCQKITYLDLSGNTGLTDISPFNYRVMTNLDTLNLSGCADLVLPLHWSMPKLTWLEISNDNSITSSGLAPVASLPQLAVLVAKDCSGFNSFDAIKNMASLTTLNLKGTIITSLPADMSGMTKLTNIDLSGDASGAQLNVAGITNLHAITTLHDFNTVVPGSPATLYFDNTNLKDVSFLDATHAAGLKTLYWRANTGLASTDIATLSGLTQLTYLALNGDTGLSDAALDTIGGLTNLNQLYMDNCGITDTSKFHTLTGLTVLSATHGSFSNLNGLEGLTSLEQLYVSYSPLHDISKLANLTHLNTFYATYTSVNELSELAGKPLSDVNVACDYLDPTPGSADMTVINALKVAGCNVTYNDQQKITITFSCDHVIFEGADPADMSEYYGQNFILPAASAKKNYAMTGWSVDYNSTPEYAPGEVIAFAWPSLPITSNTITLYATNVYVTDHPELELSGLTASAALTPAFDPLQSYYTISVPASVTSVTITPKVTAPGTTFTINGQSKASLSIYVAPGTTATAAINVINGNGMQYFVFITRAAAEASTIADPGYSVGTLNKTFDPYVTSGYTLTIPEGSPSVTFTPVKSDPASTLYIDGAKKTSKSYTIKNGQSKTVKIKVTSTAKKSKTYTIKVTRAKSTNDSITGLSVSNCTTALSFDAATQNYTMTVLENKSSVKITVAKADSNETIYIDGHKATSRSVTINNASSKTVAVKIVAQAGGSANTRYYYITLVRPPHINSFKASPATLQITAPAKQVKFTYSLAKSGGSTEIDVIISGTPYQLMARTDSSGTKTFTWDGTVPGATLTPGATYQIRLTVTYTYNTVPYSVSKTISVAVK